MIYASVKMEIQTHKSVCDKIIVLYRGDKNVELRFILLKNNFTVLDNTLAQLIIKRPSATSVFSSIVPVENNAVIFLVTSEMIDELQELGEYTFQIRLYDDNLNARVTLPPCEGGLIIKEPLIIENDSVVNVALVNNSRIASSDLEEVEIFTEDGRYIKTVWENGDIISDVRLNKLEEAIYDLSMRTGEISFINEQVDKNTNDISTILDIIDEPPIYSKPTISAALSKNTVEHNIDSSITISPTFKQNDAGPLISYSLFKGGSEIYANSTISNYTDTVKIKHNQSVSYRVVINYSDGVVKNTLLGIPYPQTSIKAGSIYYDLTVRGYALSYYGIINNSTLNSIEGLTPALRTGRGSTLTFNLNNQRIAYLYPKSFGDLTSIKDANNFDYINSYTRSELSLNDVLYNVYILTDPVTITGFKQIYS